MLSLSSGYATCQVIWLPGEAGVCKVVNETNIFSLLSTQFAISFTLSPNCNKCHKEEGQCDTPGGRFLCSKAKNEAPFRKLKYILAT
ncbi:hypothetical protein Lser_V15G11763 [Lactuca serriola]